MKRLKSVAEVFSGMSVLRTSESKKSVFCNVVCLSSHCCMWRDIYIQNHVLVYFDHVVGRFDNSIFESSCYKKHKFPIISKSTLTIFINVSSSLASKVLNKTYFSPSFRKWLLVTYRKNLRYNQSINTYVSFKSSKQIISTR